MYNLALYDIVYKINNITHLQSVLATSFDWAITHLNWKDMTGVTSAHCFLIYDGLAILKNQHSISINNVLETDELIKKLIKEDK